MGVFGEGEEVEVKRAVEVAILRVDEGVERQEGEGGQRRLWVRRV